jgi:predicted ATPase
MGERRLKDLIRAEHIYQLVISNLPADFPPIKTLDTYRHNLPIQLTSFIGREKEMEQIAQTIHEYRLVTLTGVGGTGKTRLSLQVAADLTEQFSDGVWFVELASVADPDLIPQTILTTFGISEQAGRTVLQILTDYFRERNLLLVLDNCEHLIQASAALADTLLNNSYSLKILATSREALGVKGEATWHVPSLSLPNIKHLPTLENLTQYEAVQLFIERAILVQPNFTVTNENASFVAQICSRLDGIPLALELAASRVRALSVDQIAKRLDDRFRLLTGGARTALPRQQTLRATIDWSYNLLSDDEKNLLRGLTVFSGGWTLEAAESVCIQEGSGFDILDLLSQLVDKSLVIAQDSRYRMLETTRQYAREKLLDSGEGASVHNKHLYYFLDLAEKADKEIHGPDQVDWFNKIESEYDNILAALGWSVSDKNTETAIRLLIAVEWIWRMRGHYYETRTWFNAILSLPDIAEYPAIYARLLVRVGRTSWLIGAHQDARAYLEESQSICLKLGDESEQDLAEALDFLGFVDEPVEDHNKKEILYKQSLELYKKWGNKRGMAEVIFHLGILETNRNNVALSLSLFEQSLNLFQQLGDLWGISRVYGTMGGFHLNREDYKKAKAYIDQQLFIDEKLQFRHGHFNALNSLGNIHRYQGNYANAEIYYDKSIVLARGYGINWESLAYYHLGMLALHQNDYPLAVNRFTQLFEMDRKIYEKASACDLLVAAAAIAGGTNQPERSAKLYGAAQTIFDAIDYRISALDQKEFDRHIQLARDQLGKSAFEAFSNEGRAMTMQQATEYALEVNHE